MGEKEFNMDLCNEKHGAINKKVDENASCLGELKSMLIEVQKQTAILLEMYKSLDERGKTNAARIDELRLKPAKQWDRAIGIVLNVVLAGLVSYALFGAK